MQIFHQLADIPQDFGPTVLSIGNFDGVHKAHQAVLRETVIHARQLKARAVAMTFEPHPTRILRPQEAPKLITPLKQKIALLQETGIDALLLLPFTRDLSLLAPDEFARSIIAGTLHAVEVHEGDNFRFGHNAQGNIAGLTGLGRELGFSVRVYPAITVSGMIVSSSNIRKLIAAGNVSRARHLLGRAFSIHSYPGRGRGLGHKFTVPTVNLEHYDELVPAHGVYITRVRLGDEMFNAVTNVGDRPTFGAPSFSIESHLLDFHPVEITGDTEIELCFLKRLRDEMKWPNVDALRAQIGKDVARASRYFRSTRRLLS